MPPLLSLSAGKHTQVSTHRYPTFTGRGVGGPLTSTSSQYSCKNVTGVCRRRRRRRSSCYVSVLIRVLVSPCGGRPWALCIPFLAASYPWWWYDGAHVAPLCCAAAGSGELPHGPLPGCQRCWNHPLSTEKVTYRCIKALLLLLKIGFWINENSYSDMSANKSYQHADIWQQ